MIPQTESGQTILERTKDLLATAGDTFSDAVNRMASTTESAASNVADRAIAPITSTQVTLFQNWLASHPTMERSLQILNWAGSHPIISVIILLFAIAIAWSLIKSIGRLLENSFLSILQIPFKLGYFLIQISWRSLQKLFPRLRRQVIPRQAQSLSSVGVDKISGDRQKLLEISSQLTVLNQEQNRLIQEALAILSSTQINIEDVPALLIKQDSQKIEFAATQAKSTCTD